MVIGTGVTILAVGPEPAPLRQTLTTGELFVNPRGGTDLHYLLLITVQCHNEPSTADRDECTGKESEDMY